MTDRAHNEACTPFHVFAGDDYYPMSGLGDYVGFVDDLMLARQLGENAKSDWWTVAQQDETGRLVEIDRGRHA